MFTIGNMNHKIQHIQKLTVIEGITAIQRLERNIIRLEKKIANYDISLEERLQRTLYAEVLQQIGLELNLAVSWKLAKSGYPIDTFNGYSLLSEAILALNLEEKLASLAEEPEGKKEAEEKKERIEIYIDTGSSYRLAVSGYDLVSLVNYLAKSYLISSMYRLDSSGKFIQLAYYQSEEPSL